MEVKLYQLIPTLSAQVINVVISEATRSFIGILSIYIGVYLQLHLGAPSLCEVKGLPW